MAFLATRISREMEMQMEKAPLSENPFYMVNPFSSRLSVSPWVSMSAPLLSSGSNSSPEGLGLWETSMGGRKDTKIEFLFSKILTPSDVGKPSRLLIPKKFAEKYFPKISKTKRYGKEQILAFEDSSTGLVWNFRFTLWRGSNTYVLSKGWSTFNREKKLNNGDTVSFYRGADKFVGKNRIFIHIKPQVDVSPVPHHNTVSMFTPHGLLNENDKWVCEELGLGSGCRFEPRWKHMSFGSGGLMPPMTHILQPTIFSESMSLDNSMGRAHKRLRLFGVDIEVPPYANGDDSYNGCTNGVASTILN